MSAVETSFTQYTNYVEPFHHWVKRVPDQAAVIEPHSIVTYAELEAAAFRAAGCLAAAGVAAGTHVGIVMGGSVALQAAVLVALSRMGAVQVPLASGQAEDFHDEAIARLRITHIVTDTPAPVQEIELIVPDRAWLDPAAGAPPIPPMHEDPSAPWTIVFSSGTTGAPKSAPLGHGLDLVRSAFQPAMVSPEPGERYLCLLPFELRVGRAMSMRCLQRGGTLVAATGLESPADIVSFVREQRVDLMCATPKQLAALLEGLPPGGPHLPGLRGLRTNSGGMPLDLLDRVCTVLTPFVFVDYGANDAGSIAVATPDELARHPDTCGRPLPGIDLQIVDEAHRPVSPGTPGQIRLRSPAVAPTGVDEAGGARDASREGWFYPGDNGVLNDEGLLFVHGRTDALINFGGLKVSPRKIEEVLRAHPSVIEAIAFAVPSDLSGQVPAAGVVLRDGADTDLILKYCHRKLGPQRPRLILRLDSMPRTAAGKIPYQRLVDMVLARRGGSYL